MRFAQFVFIWAAVWGVTALTPSFLLLGAASEPDAPPTLYPHFLGLLCAAAAWQIGLIIVASDPRRYRPLMIPAALAKAGFVLGIWVPQLTGQLSPMTSVVAPDAMFAILFIMAHLRLRGAQNIPADLTRDAERRGSEAWSGIYGVRLQPQDVPSGSTGGRGAGA